MITAMENLVVSTPRPGVLLVKLNRPRALNALSRELLKELGEALTEATQNDDVRCVVLTGNERAFSAGADIKEMPDGGIPMWAQSDRLRAWKIIERFPKPLIAAVNGYALGGGCELTTLCDIVVIGANAKFGFPEIKIGAFPGDGGTQRAPRAIGKARAMWMMMTGEQIDAEKACDWGFGSEVVPVERTVERALEVAEQIAKMSPIAEVMIKEEVLMTFQKPLDESLSLERKLLLWQTEDHAEGIAAFNEKRLPDYKGR
jgi:enoyl-CoA hydratase